MSLLDVEFSGRDYQHADARAYMEGSSPRFHRASSSTAPGSPLRFATQGPDAFAHGSDCDQASRPVLNLLEDLYRTALEAPEAFRVEYEATTARVLMLLEGTASAALEKGADFGENALHLAAGCGCLEVCEFLVKRHPRFNFQQDSHGHTPLHWAVRHGFLGVAQLLLSQGANATIADKRGLTGLHWAAALGFARLCRLLSGACSETVRNYCSLGWAPLHLAAYGGSAESCQALLEAAADVSAQTPDDWTPLHLAARRGNSGVLKVLIPRCSAEVLLALDSEGRSARDLAEEAGHEDATLVLQGPEDSHVHLVCKWNDILETGGPDVTLSDLLSGVLTIEAPAVEKIGKDAVEVRSRVTDLEYRVSGYVVEVRRADGPCGAAPARVYYARAPEQRKLERVQFLVPRLRSNGVALWQLGEAYQFRVTGCCERLASQLPVTTRQVASEWSVPCLLSRCKKSGRPASCSRGRGRRRSQSRPHWPPAIG
eukprot:TRINITY_DN48671_c0_g1_i1.p1 TRINITY_DN48671_c0_g1~~TRINITY_DN48671_c0_g1_i1.p1  ORF type:complete len:496 (-),score=69.19 TRINITY_DN48671_c0_g1_i1:64-1518(-)